MFRRHKPSQQPEIPRPKNDGPVSPYSLPQHHDESNWLVSYADMMTLLCGFFIMMFAISAINRPKYEVVKKEIAQEFGGKYEKPPTASLAGFISQVIDEAGVKDKTTVKFDPSGVSVSFQSTVFFDTLSAEVKPEGKAVLEKLIDAIARRGKADNKKYQVVVEGHTDSRPILSGTYPSNWELSGARAARVVRLFIDRGFPPDQLTAIGYGDTRPEYPSRTPAGTWNEEALSKNRRVVVRVLAPGVNEVPLAVAVAPASVPAKAAAAPVPATPAH